MANFLHNYKMTRVARTKERHKESGAKTKGSSAEARTEKAKRSVPSSKYSPIQQEAKDEKS